MQYGSGRVKLAIETHKSGKHTVKKHTVQTCYTKKGNDPVALLTQKRSFCAQISASNTEADVLRCQLKHKRITNILSEQFMREKGND